MMKLKTLLCLVLFAAGLVLAATPVLAAEPAAEPATGPSSPATTAPQADDAPTPDLSLLVPQPETKAQGCGGPHTHYTAAYVPIPSQQACNDQCTSWCDGLGGRVTFHDWTLRTECLCGCCV